MLWFKPTRCILFQGLEVAGKKIRRGYFSIQFELDEELAKQKYRKHNANVLQVREIC